MNHPHQSEDWMLKHLEEAGEELMPEFDTALFDSEGFMLGWAMVLVFCALISLACAIGDLSRFLK